MSDGLAVERERDIHKCDRAVREEVGDDVVNVDCRPAEGDLYLDGSAAEVRRVVPGLIEDLTNVELRRLSRADTALLGRGPGVPSIMGGEIGWCHGSVEVSKRVVDRDVDRNRSSG